MQLHRTIAHCLPRALLAAALCPAMASAATVTVPVELDYGIVAQALSDQVFTGPGGTAELYTDRLRCNTLTLAEPDVGGTEAEQLQLGAVLRLRAGTPVGGKCRFSRSWNGHVELLQRAETDPGRGVVAFRVVDSRLLDAEGENALPRFAHRWVRDYVYPRLSAVEIDLAPAVAGIQELLDLAAGAPDRPNPAGSGFPTLRLAGARPRPERLAVELQLDAAEPPEAWAPEPESPLTGEELAEWDLAWQAWDGFATWLIKTLAMDADEELTAALAETLLEARYDLRDALASDTRERDPVRDLFLKSWARLAPLVRDMQTGLPGSQALRFATFVSAGDALATVDRLAPHLGIRIDRDALRQMARALVPAVTDYQLRYDTAVDPELRELLGLDPEFDDGSEPFSWLAWLIPDAVATPIDPGLVERLNQWVPRRRDVDDYLQTMEQLLDAIATAERDQGKVPDEHLELYDTLLRATAWQESCWRQYVEREGALETIRSSAGSVGLMQINMHVWRGVYDVDDLLGNVAYNARAGNEILVHYLVDYAIRKGEHRLDGGVDNLARATYAIYNGGPRHRTRYRNPGTSASLKKIDSAFWVKYRAIQSEGPLAVKTCLAG